MLTCIVMCCIHGYIDGSMGSMQDSSNSIANALELLHSCTEPSICIQTYLQKYIFNMFNDLVTADLKNKKLNEVCHPSGP